MFVNHDSCFVSKYKLFLLLSLSCLFVGCKPEIPDNCDGGEYRLLMPVVTSHPLGVVKVGDTISVHFSLGLRSYNFSSNSEVSVDRFKKFLAGLGMIRFDSVGISGARVSAVDAKDDFLYTSPNTAIDLRDRGTRDNVVRFYLRKAQDSLKATLLLIPKRAGVFDMIIPDGIIEDAFCWTFMRANILNVSAVQNVKNFEMATGLKLDDVFGLTTTEFQLRQTDRCFLIVR